MTQSGAASAPRSRCSVVCAPGCAVARINRAATKPLRAGIAATVLTLMYLFWYTPPLFEAMGGSGLALILIGVDVVMGPALTLVVYVPGKRGLKFDLVVIGLFQIGALLYGCHIISLARPAFIVFVKDRFELVRANEIPDSVLEDAKMHRYLDLPWTGPRLVGTQFPTDADEKFKLMVSGMAGVDIQAYPKYHVPYESVKAEVAKKGLELKLLPKFNKGLTVEQLESRFGRKAAEMRYLPLRAGKSDLSVFVDAKTGDVIRYAAIKPWEYE